MEDSHNRVEIMVEVDNASDYLRICAVSVAPQSFADHGDGR
jgi:hypothetical protein